LSYLLSVKYLVSQQCENLINAIDRLYKSEVDELIRDRTYEGRMNESERWCELRHSAGRLLSYLQAVKVLVMTRKRWPELFENFEVCSIASSLLAKCPFPNERKVQEMSAEGIIGKMTSDPEIMESYKACAKELEKFGLDENIRQQSGSKSFQPYVHAEVLLLESLEKDGGTRPSRFFNGYKYIGCSKPTCRMCDYYFSFHASGVEVRPTHRNLYLNWSVPNLDHDQGPKDGEDREKLMNKILIRLRTDTLRTLSEKLPERKNHDSNTEPTYPIDSIPSQELENMEHLTIGIERLDHRSSEDELVLNSNSTVSFETRDIFAGHFEGDGEEGSLRSSKEPK